RARVVEVLEVLPDGRLNVVVEGGDRFRLLEVEHSLRSFDVGTVEELVDDRDDPPAPADAERALALFDRIQTIVGSAGDVPEQASPTLDWELASRIELPVERKQELLELTSPRRRLELLVSLLERGLQGLELQAELQRRASSNGKVTPLTE
ncbi:MAG TPA: LON peptidase substrate-binding domain-containing protein, partial [Solirubrobacteraceae bacterium]|nr:LON peptidase substrate-binding domain-containing protein [Solirubrobacteraceae bacterium]